MAMKSETPTEKVERLLGNHDKLCAVIRKHTVRLAAARGRLGGLDGDLEMWAQHRAVPDDLRERVSAALAESEIVGTDEDDTGTRTDEDDQDTLLVPDDASELGAEDVPAH